MFPVSRKKPKDFNILRSISGLIHMWKKSNMNRIYEMTYKLTDQIFSCQCKSYIIEKVAVVIDVDSGGLFFFFCSVAKSAVLHCCHGLFFSPQFKVIYPPAILMKVDPCWRGRKMLKNMIWLILG